MYFIAICDDNEAVCTEIENVLIEYSRKMELQIEIDIFNNGERLNSIITEKKYYDIVFLDINLITISGVDIANNIRYIMDNEAMQIIYISAVQGYAINLFKTRPLDFLVKPLEKKAIAEDFERAIKLIDMGNQVFEFCAGYRIHKRYYNDILYFQSNNRKISLVTSSETIQFYDKLDRVMLKLSGTDFLRIHKSYLINCAYVVEYTYEWVKMKNEMVLTISKPYRSRLREQLFLKCTNVERI